MNACHVFPILFSLMPFSGDCKMLLTFSRYRMMYNVCNFVLCATYKGKVPFICSKSTKLHALYITQYLLNVNNNVKKKMKL